MGYVIKRTGLLLYGIISIIESVGNTLLYVSHLDLCRKPFDMAMPFYFWYIDKFLKGSYISNLKNKHG